MNFTKPVLYGTLVAMLPIGILYYIFMPPQCPEHYTQQQIDGAHCIVGANIGGVPLFAVSSIVVWLGTVMLVLRFFRKQKKNRR